MEAPPSGLRSLVLLNGYASIEITALWRAPITAYLASRVPHLTRLLIGERNFSLRHLKGLSSLAELQDLWVKGDFRCWHCLMESHVTALRRLSSLTLKKQTKRHFAGTTYEICEVRALRNVRQKLPLDWVPRHKLLPTTAVWEAWARQVFPCMRRLIVDGQLISIRPPPPLDVHASWLGRRPPSSLMDILGDAWDRGAEEDGWNEVGWDNGPERRHDRGASGVATSSRRDAQLPSAPFFCLSSFPDLQNYDERIKYTRDELIKLMPSAVLIPEPCGSGEIGDDRTFPDIAAHLAASFPELYHSSTATNES